MIKENAIKLFQDQRVRVHWDTEKEKWYFSIIDVIGVLTKSKNPRKYWSVLKTRLKKEGSEVATNCSRLKLLAIDGKMRLTDVADTEQILRLIQSIPSPKAEPFKIWLAKVGYERIEETEDPELANEIVDDDYIVTVQIPDYKERPGWNGSIEKSKDFIMDNGLRFLRHYQKTAIHKLQEAVRNGKDRFLYEMATGTGKTLTSAAVIRLFLRTENARRVLFLVDRLELEDQAWKAFTNYLKPDYTTFIYKEHKSDWRKADIVVTTVQSLTFDNKYSYLFLPTDFDLIISDESHRSISGNSRAVFEYFHGYKLGLTATPKDYLKNVDINKIKENDPRKIERRMLRDTYATFGCEGGDPTYRYSLIDGVKDGFLINPKVLDARTEITTQLLSDKGYAVIIPKFKSKDELLEEEFDKFISIYPPNEDINVRALKYFFKAYVVDQNIREILKAKDFSALQTNATLPISEFKKVAPKYRDVIPEYIDEDYIDLNKFAA